jgi:hypothetical protein
MPSSVPGVSSSQAPTTGGVIEQDFGHYVDTSPAAISTFNRPGSTRPIAIGIIIKRSPRICTSPEIPGITKFTRIITKDGNGLVLRGGKTRS